MAHQGIGQGNSAPFFPLAKRGQTMKSKSIYNAAAAALLLLRSRSCCTHFQGCRSRRPTRADTYSNAAKRAGSLRRGSRSKPSGCRRGLSGRLVLRPPRIFKGRNFGEAPTGQPAHRYRVWPQYDEQFRTLPWTIRAITQYTLWQPAVDQLKETIFPKASGSSGDASGSRFRPDCATTKLKEG